MQRFCIRTSTATSYVEVQVLFKILLTLQCRCRCRYLTLQQLLDFQLKETAWAALPIFRYLFSSGQEFSYDVMYLQKNLHHCVTKSGPDNALVQVQMQVHDIVAI